MFVVNGLLLYKRDRGEDITLLKTFRTMTAETLMANKKIKREGLTTPSLFIINSTECWSNKNFVGKFERKRHNHFVEKWDEDYIILENEMDIGVSWIVAPLFEYLM